MAGVKGVWSAGTKYTRPVSDIRGFFLRRRSEASGAIKKGHV